MKSSRLLPLPLLLSCLCAPLPGNAEPKEIEIKFVVKEGAAPHAAVWKLLDPSGGGLQKVEHTDEEVCFFDTDPPSLGDLILRARHKRKIDPEKPDKVKEFTDSTVKVRVDAQNTKPVGDFEKGIPAEDDWTNTQHANTSRAIDWETKKEGPAGPDAAAFATASKDGRLGESLFQGDGQKKLIDAHAAGLKWDGMKCYGPVHAQVWKKEFKVSPSFPKATIEDWKLETPGKEPVMMLEISIKLEVADDAEAKAKTAAFFDALKTAGFGSPETTSKTTRMLKYYRSGP